MPEYHLDVHGDYGTWKRLDAFTRGYIQAMFFTNCSCADDGELDGATFEELAPQALATIITDCKAFQDANQADLDEACDNGRINGYDMERAGMDFWYTRNGHGCGFWDRDLGEVGDRLTKACGWRTPWGEIDPYRGDDGRVYI